MNRILMLCLIGMLAVSTSLFAEQTPTVERFLAPDGRFESSLDNEEPDTLAYDDNGATFYFSALTNYYVYVRFTTPANFELRSIYLCLGNPSGNTAACSVFVHTPNGNQPGALLSSFVVPNVPTGSGWMDITLPDTVTLAENESFMVVIGRAPGPNGWYPLLDGSSTVNRSYYTTGNRISGTYTNISNDVKIRAGGEFELFTDIEATECFNEIASTTEPAFNVLPGEVITLKTLVTNPSNSDVEVYTVNWSVTGPQGTNVFTDEVAGTDLNALGTQTMTAGETFSAEDEGAYMCRTIVGTADDANALNDTTWLRFYAGENHRWYAYDDGTVEGNVFFGLGNGTGVSFTPTTYPARVETVAVNLGAAEANGEIRIYMNGNDGAPEANPVWSDQTAMIAGWTYIPVNPPVDVFDGSFTVCYIYTVAGLGKDNNPPNAAAITNMGTMAWQFGGGWEADLVGNWCLQAYVDTSSAVPPFPVIDTSTDTLQFGEVPINANPVTVSFMVYNLGAIDNLNITGSTINPPGIRPVYSLSQTTYTVAPGDSHEVTLTFDPVNVQLYNGLLVLANNSENAPSRNLIIRGSGGAAVSAENPEGFMPTAFDLSQNYPNPFNPSTEIEFALPTASNVKLTVVNMLGQEVATLASGTYSAGIHTAVFDGTNLTSGIYFYRLEAADFVSVRKMMLMK